MITNKKTFKKREIVYGISNDLYPLEMIYVCRYSSDSHLVKMSDNIILQVYDSAIFSDPIEAFNTAKRRREYKNEISSKH